RPPLPPLSALFPYTTLFRSYLREISYALGRILPAGSATAIAYLKGTTYRPVGLLISTSLLTLWTASGVMISWMEGFRNAYQLPKDRKSTRLNSSHVAISYAV